MKPAMTSEMEPTPNDVAEKRFGGVTPSLLLAAPGAILGIAIALLLGHYVVPHLINSPIGKLIPPIVFWLGLWVLCLAKTGWQLLVLATTRYEITSQRIIYKRGVFNRSQDQLEIVRIRDLSTYRPFIQRLVGLGTLNLETVDRTHPTLAIPGMHNIDELKHFLHKLNTAERSRLGYREFESTM